MFDLLLEDGPLCLTAVTRVSWGSYVDTVDQVLFHLAEHRSLAVVAKQLGIGIDEVASIAEASGEPEFCGID
jgi:hypothetical protein